MDRIYADSQLQLYVNAKLVITASVPSTTSILSFSSNGLWTVGAAPNAQSDFFASGLDEIRLWKRGLSQTEISEHYHHHLPAEEDPGLVGWWAFDEGEGAETVDRSLRGQTASLISPTWSGKQKYSLYHTSALNLDTGLPAHEILELGVQTLTMTSSNPLLLFNLDVSPEWDAHQDAQFLAELEFDIKRTSQFLYDWINGQAALGNVTVYQDQERWLDADLQIYATNRLHPNNVHQGGWDCDYSCDRHNFHFDTDLHAGLSTDGCELESLWSAS